MSEEQERLDEIYKNCTDNEDKVRKIYQLYRKIADEEKWSDHDLAMQEHWLYMQHGDEPK